MDVKTYAVALDIMCGILDAEARAEGRRCEDSCPLFRYGCGVIDDYDSKTLANIEGTQKEVVRFFDERGWLVPNLAGIRGQHKDPCERPGAPQSGFNSKGIQKVREKPQTTRKTNSGRFKDDGEEQNTTSERAGFPGRGLDGFTGINRPTGEKNAAEGECGAFSGFFESGEIVREKGGERVGAVVEIQRHPGEPIIYRVEFEGGERGSYTADNLALLPDPPTSTLRQAVERLNEYFKLAGFCFPEGDTDTTSHGMFQQDTEPNEYRY